jgi:hypothetical protein
MLQIMPNVMDTVADFDYAKAGFMQAKIHQWLAAAPKADRLLGAGQPGAAAGMKSNLKPSQR